MKEIHFETGGINFPNPPKDDTKLEKGLPKIDSDAINKAFKKLSGDVQLREATPEEKNAKAQLDNIVSSTGMKYSDAEKIIKEIREEYDYAFSEVEEEQKQPEGSLVYYPPVKVRKFNPNKLPPEIREKYQEAIAAKREIENNNSALKEQAGILVTEMSKDVPIYNINKYSSDDMNYDGGIHRDTPITAPEVTPKQQHAREKMNEKISSSGMRYVDAQRTISQIQDKYANDEKYQSEFPQEQDSYTLAYRMPVKKFDPYKLPEPDKTKYFEAIKSIIEIEEKNSALMEQTGWVFTQQPQIIQKDPKFLNL